MVRQNRSAGDVRGRLRFTRLSAAAGIAAVVLPAVLTAAGGPGAASEAGRGGACPWLDRSRPAGHDLSYWDDAAGGWARAAGRYQVYVGDSSALAGLPLRGGFTVVPQVPWPFTRH